MSEQTKLPKTTQDAYDELSSQATLPEEVKDLQEMHTNDVKEREKAIKDIANQPLPTLDPSGVALTQEEQQDQLERRQHGDTDEYGQGGRRA